MVNKVNLRADRISRSPAACDKCTRQCVTLHGNTNRSSDAIYGFFKFMHGKDCGKLLYLPPKFARTVKHLVGTEAALEDTNGCKWPATFSNINGSLSLQKGWDKFFREHNLEYGDVLVFNYMDAGHFIVHIYDKSACRIYDFSSRRPQKNKRCKSHPIVADEEDNHQNVEKNSKDKSNLNTSYVPAPEISNGQNNVMGNIVPKDVGNSQIEPTCITLEEDPICMLNRDVDYPLEDRILQDLSFYEMKKTTSDANDVNKSVEGTSVPRDDTEMSDGLVTHQLHEERSDYGDCSHDLSHFEMKKTVSDANDFEKYLEEAITPNDDTDMIDSFFTDQFYEKPSDNANFTTSMQIDATVIQNDGGGILTSVAESRYISSSHVLEPDVNNTEQVLSIKRELVESRETGKAPTHDSLPIAGSQYLGSILNIPPAEQISSSEKEVLESGEKGKAPTHVSLPITSSPLVSSMLNITPVAAHVSSIKKQLVESREKNKAPAHVSQPIISTQVLCSMLNIRPAKHCSSITNELVESRDKGQAPAHVSLPRINSGNLPTMEMRSGQTSPAVKIEPGMLSDTIPSVATTSFCAQVKSLHYLELPVSFTRSPQQKGDMGQGQVVFLRDPSGKLWPVFHPDLFYVRAFTGNWINFCEANHVVPGDVCKFQLESNDSSSCIYRVDVEKSG